MKRESKLSRPELILLLLYEPGSSGKVAEPVVGKTRLMKLLFLLSKEADIDDFLAENQAFRFVPFRYGPFDADVYDDVEALKQLGLVQVKASEQEEEDDDTALSDPYDASTEYELTLAGQDKAREILQSTPKDVVNRVTRVKSIFGPMPLVQLLHYVYGKYEYYASASDIKGKIAND